MYTASTSLELSSHLTAVCIPRIFVSLNPFVPSFIRKILAMAPLTRSKGRSRLSAAFDDVYEKKGKANEAGIQKAIVRAAARNNRRVSGGHGQYKCILCHKGFSRRATIFDNHFAHCVRKTGNPNGYAWDEDPSCWKRNEGPSGVFAPGLDLNNQPVSFESTDSYFLSRLPQLIPHQSSSTAMAVATLMSTISP